MPVLEHPYLGAVEGGHEAELFLADPDPPTDADEVSAEGAAMSIAAGSLPRLPPIIAEQGVEVDGDPRRQSEIAIALDQAAHG